MGVDVVILSTPLGAIPKIAPLFADVPLTPSSSTRPTTIPSVTARLRRSKRTDGERVVAEQIGRPIAKAWNAITSASLPRRARLPGQRAESRSRRRRWCRERDVAMTLVDETGLDAVYSGNLAES